MSIVRVSANTRYMFAPDAIGNLDYDMYDEARGKGFLQELVDNRLAKPGDRLLRYLRAELATKASNLPPNAPVTVMVHGFAFSLMARVDPDADPAETENPHGRLFHFKNRDEEHEQEEHTTGWPLHLGFSPTDSGESGLAVAFGWSSGAGKANISETIAVLAQSVYRPAFENATKTAWSLVNVIRGLVLALGDRPNPIDIVCHSLGTRVVVQALTQAADLGVDVVTKRIGRVILLGGAEYSADARTMLDSVIPDGPSADFTCYNVMCSVDWVLKRLGTTSGPREDAVIGFNGLPVQSGEPWLNLQIDRDNLQRWFADHGVSVEGNRPGDFKNHWYYFTNRRNMAFYRDALRSRGSWTLAAFADSPASTFA